MGLVREVDGWGDARTHSSNCRGMLAPTTVNAVRNPIGSVVGLARTLIASATLLTIASEAPETLFDPTGQPLMAMDGGLLSRKWTLFGIVSDLHLAKWIAIGILLLVASGWRPRWTGLLHWWVTYSFQTACGVPDGSDQVANVLTLLLIPVTLCDARPSHWSTVREVTGYWPIVGSRVAYYALSAIRFQVALIYYQAGVGKLAVPAWADGTALYYYFADPGIGLQSTLRHSWLGLARNGAVLCALTWAPIALELLLVLALTGSRRYRRLLLGPSILFHFANWVIFGLGSFFLAMTGALLLYLPPIGAGALTLVPRAIRTLAGERTALNLKMGIGKLATAVTYLRRG